MIKVFGSWIFLHRDFLTILIMVTEQLHWRNVLCGCFRLIWLWLIIAIMKRYAERCAMQLYRTSWKCKIPTIKITWNLECYFLWPGLKLGNLGNFGNSGNFFPRFLNPSFRFWPKKTQNNISEISEIFEFSNYHFFIFQKKKLFQYSKHVLYSF